MAARKQVKRIPPTTPDDVELANLDSALLPAPGAPMTAAEERREREVEDVAAELGSDGRVKVWHIIDGKSVYAGELSAAEFTLDALMDAYGGGDKSLVLMQGKTKVDTYRVSLDPTVPPKSPRTAKQMAAALSPVPQQDMTGMMTLMMKSSMDNAQAMNTMMMGIVTALTTVMGATKPATDPMETALKMAEVMKGRGGDTSEAMTMFREGLKLAERFADKDDGDGTMQVVSKGMDTLAVLVEGIVSAQKAKQNQPVAVIPPPGATSTDFPGAPRGPGDTITTAPVDPSRPLANGTMPTIRPWVDAARPNIGALLKASTFLPASTAAGAISNMLDDDQFNDLIDDIQDQTNGGFGTRLAEYFPNEIEGINAEWIGQVIHVLLTEHVEAEEEETTGDGANANNN